MDTEKIIWSNENIDISDYKEYLDEYYPEVTNDYEKYQIASQLNDDNFEDDKSNLDYMVNDIIVIAELGLWDGRRNAYKIIKNASIVDCLSDEGCEYVTWYIDSRHDFRCRAIHHDGTNTYLYRSIKNDVGDIALNNMFENILNGTLTRKELTNKTESIGKVIEEIYGW